MTGFSPDNRMKAISIVMTAIVVVLISRLIYIQILEHESYIQRAKKQWLELKKVRALRGRIFDRNGFPLAVTNWSYAVGVTPAVFPKEKSEAVACLAESCALTKKELRRILTRDRSPYIPLGRDLRLTQNQVTTLSSLAGVRLDPSHDRLYPFPAIPAQFMGSVDGDGRGIAGIEAGFQSILGGKDGWVLESRIPGSKFGYRPVYGPREKAIAGCDLYLSIDTRIQAVVDFELAQAVDRYKALSGIAIVANPWTGDILAISEKPDRKVGQDARKSETAALRSISFTYEPGSVFKLVSYAYLLETKRARPIDSFFVGNGVQTFDWGTIRDDHPTREWLTLKQGFGYSSNICTIKAMMGADRDEFYRFILKLGFAGKTGIDLPAEAKGFLRSPASWSMRSLPSIAIGHEIGVTPIQLVMAYCALANGGTLLAPRLALEARDPSGKLLQRFDPVIVREAISEETAKTLRDFCRFAVLEGTAKAAAVEDIPVAGKTGTAQKIENGIYRHDKFLASFIGFAPAERPRIVCLVILDEPEHPYWWGGSSAAPTFARIIQGINLATDLLAGDRISSIAVKGDKIGRKRVPNFLRLTTAQAVELASRSGIAIEYPKIRGFVFSQSPDPGTIVGRNEVVNLLICPESGQTYKEIVVPSVIGMSLREARRMLLACGFECRVNGSGTVEQQEPLAGQSIPPGSLVSIYCSVKKEEQEDTAKFSMIGGMR